MDSTRYEAKMPDAMIPSTIVMKMPLRQREERMGTSNIRTCVIRYPKRSAGSGTCSPVQGRGQSTTAKQAFTGHWQLACKSSRQVADIPIHRLP